MALTLDATVGGANANSYNTQAENDALLEAVPWASATWAALTSAIKDVNSVRATFALDVEFDYLGNRADLTTPQALEWPRANVVILDRGTIASNIIPSEIKQAQAELAHYYSQQTEQPEAAAGLSDLELPGGLKLGFKESTVRSTGAIPPHIGQIIRKFLVSSQSSGAFAAVVRG